MEATHQKSKLVYKYLFSYLALLLIPLLILVILIRWRFMETLENQINENNLNRLSTIRFAVDNELGELSEIIEQIYLTDDLKPYSFNDLYETKSIIQQLNKFTSTNSFIRDIFLYYRGSDYIYSSTSSYKLTFFLESMYSYARWDHELFIHNINNLKQPTLRLPESLTIYDEQPRPYLTYMYPLTFNNLPPFGTLMFLIPMESLDAIINPQDNGYIVILDDKGRIVSAPDSLDVHTNQNFMNTIRQDQASFQQEMHIGNEAFLVSGIQSDTTHWQYIAVSPMAKALGPINDTYRLLIMGVIIIFLCSGVLIYYLMKANYRPLMQLITFSNDLLPEEQPKELASVRRTMEFLSERNSKLNLEVQGSFQACRNHFITQLIKGEVRHNQDFNALANKYQLPLAKKHFTCVLITISSSKGISYNPKAIVSYICQQNGPHHHYYCREGIESHKLLLIISTDFNKRDQLVSTLETLQASIDTQLGIRATMGVGKTYPKCSSLPLSYMDAVIALNYQFIHGKRSILFYTKVVKHFSYQDYHPGSDLKLLQQAIKNGNGQDIDEATECFLKHIKEHNLPLFIIRNSCYEIIHFLLSMTRKHHIKLDYYPDVFELSHYDTMDELMSIIRDMSHKVSRHMATITTRETSTSLDNLQQYMNNHYTNYDFSLHKMAEYFNLHPSHLSALYKELTRETVYDYVTKLRMEESVKLLTTTNKAIKTIATDIGYDNSSSFIRRFKQVYNLTPGKYRKLYKE